jgi:hypothetical protein
MVTTPTSSHVEQNTNSNLHAVPGTMIDRGRADKAAAKQLEHEWAVILAGGDGTRLKFLTRRITGDERPKQFCPVLGDQALLEETRKRVALEVARERTLFLLNRLHERFYSEILSDTPAGNLIEQPRNVGTAPAILRSRSGACPGAAHGSESKRHQMERPWGTKPFLASIQLAGLRPRWVKNADHLQQ